MENEAATKTTAAETATSTILRCVESIERKADTMKIYILRDPNSVEPQTAQFLQQFGPARPSQQATPPLRLQKQFSRKLIHQTKGPVILAGGSARQPAARVLIVDAHRSSYPWS